MKKLLILLFLCCLALPAAEASDPSAKRTVIDYYNLTKGEGEPKIVKSNGAWRIDNPDVPITLTVADIPNGYIEFMDPGTGGGSTAVTAALFLAANGEPMLAVHEHAWTTGTCPDPAYTLKIYHMEMGRMDQIRKVIPELSLGLFLKKGFDPKKSSPSVNAERNLRIGYRLPRKGTTVEAFLDASNLECGIAMAGDLPKKERQEKEEFLRNVRKEPVKLKWNKASGSFDPPAEN